MNLFNTFKNNLDEVVFEQRNKAYGAYAIRKAYPDHVNFSIAITLVPMLLVIAGGLASGNFHTAPPNLFAHLTDSKLTKPIESHPVELSIITFEMPVAGNLAPAYHIVKNELVSETIEKIDALKPVTGSLNGLANGPSTTALPGIGTFPPGPIMNNKPEAGPPSVSDYVEDMPEFPGGKKAMYEFIRQNLQYPKWALENNVGGKVVISFVVMPDGSIQMAKVLKSIGFGCDDEALRMINEMPVWKAGSQNGNKVAVRFMLPINFQSTQ